jgi:hypothetical protein
MVAFEYDLQSVDIATRNIVANIQSASLGTGATKNFTSNSSEIQAILDLSGQYWNYVSLSRNDMTNKINYVTSSWDQLYSSHIDDLGNLINCNIYGDFYNLELIDSNLTQFFAVTVEDGSPMMLYDTAEDSSTRRSNVGGLVQQAANYYSNITRDATELSNRFNRYSNAIRDELTSNINTTFSEITSNISFITTVVPMIVSNMNAAYPIMAASNYTGKYTYLYDYVKAMLGMCNDILTVARTNSNGPVYAPLTDPVTSPSMDYNYSNLYYTSADGAGAPPNQIKLRRGLYQYINDRYLNLPTSYSTIQGEVNRVMSLPGVSLDNLRDKYSNLLTASVTPEIDQFQIAQYSNSIFGTSTQTGGGVAITPATKTEADLRAYIANHFRSLTDSNFAAAQETTNCLNLWNAIQSNANDVKSRVETLRSQTEADLYYLDDPAFTTITTWRSQLLDAYAQADFTLINDAQYFTGTFTNTNTNRSGSFFEVFGAAVIQALAAQALTPDNQALVDLLNAPSFVTILGTYTNARNQKRLDMQSNITNIKNNITSLKALSDNLHTSLLSNIQIDLPRLEAKKLNAACFEFYPTVVAAQAELRSNVNELQAKITEVNNIPYTSTNATLADLDTYTEDILFHSNAVNNIYLVASNYNVILTGKTDELLIAYNNAYSNIDSNIVMNLPIFTGSNCSTSNIVQVTTR